MNEETNIFSHHEIAKRSPSEYHILKQDHFISLHEVENGKSEKSNQSDIINSNKSIYFLIIFLFLRR